jgi:CRISPR-associated Csx3 family protein
MEGGIRNTSPANKKMELVVQKNGDITFIEIQKNGSLVNAQNPVTPDEISDLEFPDLKGKGLMISGMPMYAIAAVALWYKNTFAWIATVDPRSGGAIVCHTMSPEIKMGQVIPLP